MMSGSEAKTTPIAKYLIILKGTMLLNFEKYHEYTREIIRLDYRLTLGYKPTAEVMSLVPNIMTMNDHEIHNNLILDESFND